MRTITTIGLDIAKSVFQVHGVDADGQVVIRRQLDRRYVLAFFQKLPSCLIGIEACASAHHWSRELQALGHTVRLMPGGKADIAFSECHVCFWTQSGRARGAVHSIISGHSRAFRKCLLAARRQTSGCQKLFPTAS
jgi:hypothetical protein